MLQNVNEVNREPAHIEWRLVHVILTKQNCLVTIFINRKLLKWGSEYCTCSVLESCVCQMVLILDDKTSRTQFLRSIMVFKWHLKS